MTNPFDNYEIVIGLECHIQLLTQTKLFSPAPNHFGDAANTNVDVVDLGLPGVLPVVNLRAVEFAIRLGSALGCDLRRRNVFSRKHYFYPDLPKGYQISQYDEPICEKGSLLIRSPSGEKTIGITRIHMEEDAGKNIHVEGGNSSFVDFNRAGTPLVELVTEPDLRSAEDAMETFKTIRSIAMYLGICDGNLQEGSMRADVNVSVRKKGDSRLGTRTETKNLNSIRFLGQAIQFEAHRQILELEAGRPILQETRLWDSVRKESRSLRSKEEAHDYRYFPDPDLLPLNLSEDWIVDVKTRLPELPKAKATRFQKDLLLSPYDAEILTSEKPLADYFETALKIHSNAKGIANWIINDVLRVVKNGLDEDGGSGIERCKIPAASIGKLVELVDSKAITGKMAKELFEELCTHPTMQPAEIVANKDWKVERNENAIRDAIERVINANPGEVEKYRAGKTRVLGFLMGQVMKETKGQADPAETSRLLEQILKG